MRLLTHNLLFYVLLFVSHSALLRAEGGSLYSPIGKRDPFRVPAPSKDVARGVSSIGILEQFGLEQLHLRAILAGLGNKRAMFEDPSGQSHIIVEGQVFGRERATVSRILETEVIVTQRTKNHLGEESLLERIYSLKKDEEVVAPPPMDATSSPTRPIEMRKEVP